jgi:DinB superfamily
MSMLPVTAEHPRTLTTDHLPIVTASLRNTPAVLSSLLANAPETLLYSREAPEAWTPVQVVEHLIVAERRAWIPRVRSILSGEGQLPPFDRIEHLSREPRAVTEALAEFAVLRSESLDVLQTLQLTAHDLERTAIHHELGRVTLSQLLATWVAHDLSHLTQISRTMVRQLHDAVGPWCTFLSTLRDYPSPR